MIELLIGAALLAAGSKQAKKAAVAVAPVIATVGAANWTRKVQTKLNSDKTVTIDGHNPIAPEELARREGLPLEVYSLARVIQSEHGNDPQIVQIAVGHAVWNQARATKQTITKLLTNCYRSRNVRPGCHGFYGAQEQGRYAATPQDPRPMQVGIAQGILSGAIKDPTGGARQFDCPRAFGKQPGTTVAMAEKVAAQRRAAGNTMVLLPGISEDRFRAWRPKGVVG